MIMNPGVVTINEKRQHNLLLPISRIPNEILSKIFCVLRNRYVRATRWRRHGPNCLKGWIAITHVCHTWREIALNTSLLWCHIDVLPHGRNWIPELLRRSKHSPLTLIIEWVSHKDGISEAMKMNLGRVRELVLNAPAEITFQKIQLSKFQGLKALEISCNNDQFVLNDSHLQAEFLRSLVLRSCSIDWNSKFLPGLTHLRLVNIPKNCKLGCNKFTFVLSKIPFLESLHLSFFLDEEDKVEASKVHLQHLQQLYVKCAVPEMAQFLPSLVIPRSCKLHIYTGNDYDRVCQKFRVILSWVSNQLRVSTSNASDTDHEQYIRSFHLRHDPEMVDFNVCGFSDVLSHEQLATAEPILKFCVWWTYEDDDFSFNLQTFLSLLPLGGMAFLDVKTDFEVYLSPELWTVAFGSIQTLKRVYLNTDTSNFWKALIPENSDNRPVESLPFSALTSLTVHDYDLDSRLILDNLRTRSALGGTDLLISWRGEEVLPAHILTQLGELAPRIQVVAYDANGSPAVDGEFIEDDEF